MYHDVAFKAFNRKIVDAKYHRGDKIFEMDADHPPRELDDVQASVDLAKGQQVSEQSYQHPLRGSEIPRYIPYFSAVEIWYVLLF